MATTLPPPGSEVLSLPERPETGNTGNGGQNLIPVGGNVFATQQYSPPASTNAIWAFNVSICMSFDASTSALIVCHGSSTDWRHITLPHVLFLSSLLLLASFITLEVARGSVASFM